MASDDETNKDDEGAPKIELIELEIGGVKVKVPKDSATVINSQMSALNDGIEQRDELLKQFTTAGGAQQQEMDLGEDQDIDEFETAFFADPKKALEERDAKLAEKIKGELTKEYQSAQSQQAFWSDFYKEHDEIDRKKHGFIVQHVLDENLTKWKKLDTPTLADELAKASMEKIQELGGSLRKKEENKGPSKTSSLEGAQGMSGGPSGGHGSTIGEGQPDSEEDKLGSMTAYLKKRRQARRKAAASGQPRTVTA